MQYVIIILSVIILVSVLFFIALRIIFGMTFSAPDKDDDITTSIPDNDQFNPVRENMLSLIGELDKQEYEEIYIKSFDNLSLFGRYYPADTVKGVIELEFHGYRGSAIRDYCGGSAINRKRGISTILVDQRSHGKSEGNAITFGIKERYDVLSWVNYASERFGSDTKIILSGISMGAATVLMASELDLPKNVVAILADCPYSSPEEIIRHVARKMGFPPVLVMPLVKLSARLFLKIGLSDSTAVDAVKKTNIPVLIIHGDDDRYVPYEMGKKIFDACASEKRMLTVKGAGHGLCYFVDNEAYVKTVSEFTEKYI